MKNIRLIKIVLIITVLCAIMIPFLINAIRATVNFSKGHEIAIFSDLSECYDLEKCEGVQVQRYDNIKEDKDLKNLNYKEKYAAEYSCTEFEFEIFAYEFNSEEAAKEYVKNITGTEHDENPVYSGSGGFFSYRLVVKDGKMAYKILTSTKDQYRVMEFLYQNFTVKIDE